ncbi:MAG: hypothetical protein ACJAVR_001092 [Paracoccaceae bacterium]|jgi:hypothetical protein
MFDAAYSGGFMAEGHIDYGGLMQRALRGVMAQTLGLVAEDGLVGGHHFYITFDTGHAGVDMPAWLRAQYPEEITIVLQNEYWDLVVLQDRFSVGLSFSGRSAALAIPFDAVTRFVDPHAEFGLKFDAHDMDDEDLSGEDDADPEPPHNGGGDVVSLDRFRKT